jgi:5-methylcytosine-specific restriction endonuclease McrA
MTKEVSKYSAGTYEKRFGSWRKSLEAFVNWVNEGTLPKSPESKPKKNLKRTSRTINWRLRAMVLMKDGAKCKLCGATPQNGNTKLHVDHITPWAKGAETVFENLQILCEKCNIGKSDIDPSNLV